MLPRRVGAYSPTWMDQLRASGEVVWVGAGALGRNSGRVALYFRDDAAAIGRPGTRGPAPEPPADPVHGAIRERLGAAPCFFTDLLAELGDVAPEELQEGLWDLVWAGEVDERRVRAAARAAADARPRTAGADGGHGPRPGGASARGAAPARRRRSRAAGR